MKAKTPDELQEFLHEAKEVWQALGNDEAFEFSIFIVMARTQIEILRTLNLIEAKVNE